LKELSQNGKHVAALNIQNLFISKCQVDRVDDLFSVALPISLSVSPPLSLSLSLSLSLEKAA
jgi:hypothetical protein